MGAFKERMGEKVEDVLFEYKGFMLYMRFFYLKELEYFLMVQEEDRVKKEGRKKHRRTLKKKKKNVKS